MIDGVYYLLQEIYGIENKNNQQTAPKVANLQELLTVPNSFGEANQTWNFDIKKNENSFVMLSTPSVF